MSGPINVDPATIEALKLIVLGYLGAGAAKVGMAPFDAAADRLKSAFGARLDDLILRARRKSGGRPLGANPRVAVKILNEAAFNDDSIVADYLAGVLAASDVDDDSGVAVTALIGRLSAVHLRLHYIVYREIRRLWPVGAEEFRPYDELRARRAAVAIPLGDLIAALPPLPAGGLNNAIEVLRRENLIGTEWSFAPGESQDWVYRVAPSGLGAELFLWGHGIRPPAAWRLVELELDALDVPETPNATLLHSHHGERTERQFPSRPDVQSAAPDVLTADE